MKPVQKPPAIGEGDINLSPERDSWHRGQDNRTTELLERDSRAFFHQSLSTPCLDVVTGCSGSVLTTLSGKQYYDFHGNSVHQVGFAHPAVVSALHDQLDRLSFCTRRYTNIPAIELAEKLADLTDSRFKALFAPGATSAVGMALKLARKVTGRFKTISMWDAFHGASLDAISVGGESLFREGVGPLLTGCEHVPPPNPVDCVLNPEGKCRTCGLRCAHYVEYVLEKERDIAAVIAEPIRCTAVNPPPAGYWQTIREACDRHGALLIFDETAICLGRTGKMFAYEHYVEPDILVIGKGLGGGIMPLAAVLARTEFDICGDTALGHYTHEKNPLSCRAGLATIETIESEGLVTRSHKLGKHLIKRLQALRERYEIVDDVKGLGLMAGIWVDSPERAERVMYDCLDNGLSFKVSQGRCLTLTPPLNIPEEQLEEALQILGTSIASASANH